MGAFGTISVDMEQWQFILMAGQAINHSRAKWEIDRMPESMINSFMEGWLVYFGAPLYILT